MIKLNKSFLLIMAALLLSVGLVAAIFVFMSGSKAIANGKQANFTCTVDPMIGLATYDVRIIGDSVDELLVSGSNELSVFKVPVTVKPADYNNLAGNYTIQCHAKETSCDPCCCDEDTKTSILQVIQCPPNYWTCSADQVRQYWTWDLVNMKCIASMTLLGENCNLKDNWYTTGNNRWTSSGQCTEKQQKEQVYKDYSCTNSSTENCTYVITQTNWTDTGSTRNKADGTTCSDGKFCTVKDVCISGICKGSPMNCSTNNFPGVSTCDNNPDAIHVTWDFRKSFTSVCDETNDKCTIGNKSISHICDKARCGAKCNSSTDCAPKCVGNIRYFSGICNATSGCSCSYKTENCDSYDKWYDTGRTRWVPVNSTNMCQEKQQKEQEYRDYSCRACTSVSCSYIVTKTQWIDLSYRRTV